MFSLRQIRKNERFRRQYPRAPCDFDPNQTARSSIYIDEVRVYGAPRNGPEVGQEPGILEKKISPKINLLK